MCARPTPRKSRHSKSGSVGTRHAPVGQYARAVALAPSQKGAAAVDNRIRRHAEYTSAAFAFGLGQRAARFLALTIVFLTLTVIH